MKRYLSDELARRLRERARKVLEAGGTPRYADWARELNLPVHVVRKAAAGKTYAR